MATLKVYITSVLDNIVNARYVSLSVEQISELKLMFELATFTPSVYGQYHFTQSMNPVDMVLEVDPDDYLEVISMLPEHSPYIPWNDFGIKFGEPFDQC